jgi:hypothetical protein
MPMAEPVAAATSRNRSVASRVRACLRAMPLLLVGAVLVAGCGPTARKETRAPKTVSFEAHVSNGQVEGGVQHWKIQRNDTMQIAVSSDRTDVLVLEGYDQQLPINAGATATITRPATKLGTSKVLLGTSKVQVATLTVRK